MQAKTAAEIVNLPLTFTPRASPLPADLRPAFRLSILLLIIEHCRSRKASVEQLHVMDWSIRTVESRRLFLEFTNGNKTPDDIIVRYDPSLSRAIDFALAEDLISQYDSSTADRATSSMSVFRFNLTEKGRVLVSELMAMDCLQDEKQFFREIGSRITQDQVRGLFKRSN